MIKTGVIVGAICPHFFKRVQSVYNEKKLKFVLKFDLKKWRGSFITYYFIHPCLFHPL